MLNTDTFSSFSIPLLLLFVLSGAFPVKGNKHKQTHRDHAETKQKPLMSASKISTLFVDQIFPVKLMFEK